jgi:hypothetical protein
MKIFVFLIFFWHKWIKYINSLRRTEVCLIIPIYCQKESIVLTPRRQRPFFGQFLDFGQANVDTIFVQKISNFWWTCGLILVWRCTNFYKIPIVGFTVMPLKTLFSSDAGSFGQPKVLLFNFSGLDFYSSSTSKSSKTHQIY